VYGCLFHYESKIMTNRPANNKGNMPLSSLLQAISSILFCAGLSCGVFAHGLLTGINGTPVSEKKCPELISQQNEPRFRLAEYLRLHQGMSLEAVEAILGRGVEVSQTLITTTYIWKQPQSIITAIFEKGKLKTKTQTGLE
jgi:hypothetical protein